MRFRPSAPKFEKEPEPEPRKPKSGGSEVPAAAESFPEPEQPVDTAVPSTTAGIRDWVGDSWERAEEALAQERRSGKPRTKLVGWLEDFLSQADR